MLKNDKDDNDSNKKGGGGSGGPGWDWDSNRAAKEARDRQQQQTANDAIMTGAAVAGAAILIWEIGKGIVAIGGAPFTGGGSLGLLLLP